MPALFAALAAPINRIANKFSRNKSGLTNSLPASLDNTQFVYDAVQSKGRRRAPTGILRSEDHELRPLERRKLISGARDTVRNFTVAQWGIRKHLDYTSTFSFRAKLKNKTQDRLVQDFMSRWSAKDRCDIAGRHSLPAITRMMESRRVVDGDVFLMRLSNGFIQPIEGDRIATPIGGIPTGMDTSNILHGVQLDHATGRAVSYALNRRGVLSDYHPTSSTPMTFERMIPAANLYQHSCYERFDQVRGISPMASSLNTLQDLYEGFDYALGKMKIAQLFGMVFTRKVGEALGPIEEAEDSTEERPHYKVNFGNGPFVMDLDDGDDAKFLEAASPSDQFQGFSQTMISIALKSLDIPYSFFAENFTNYSGARQALLQYQLGCEIKRLDVVDMLDWITAWRLMLAIEDGELDVDPSAVVWEWVAKGIPWIDPLNEVQANLAAVDGGIQSRTRVLKAQGLEFEEIIAELANERDIAAAAGITLSSKPVAVPANVPPAKEQAA